MVCQVISNVGDARSKPITSTTDDQFFELISHKPIKLNLSLQPIRQTTRSFEIPNASQESSGGSTRRYTPKNHNDLFDLENLSFSWHEEWRAEIQSPSFAEAVLTAGQRIVVVQDGNWELFNLDGKKLNKGQLGAGKVYFNGEYFYITDTDGMIVAHRLSDGASAFGVSLFLRCGI